MATSPEVVKWKEAGQTVKLEKNGKRRTGGWAKALPDIEWFVKHASKPAKAAGKKLFLWGFSMVCPRMCPLACRDLTSRAAAK